MRIVLLVGVLLAAGAVVTAVVVLLDGPDPFVPQAPSPEVEPEDPLTELPAPDPMSVTGRVVDPAGAPLASVDVYLLSPENPLVPADEPQRVRTGEDGTFILRGMKGERVDIVAYRAGFRPGVVTDVSPGTTHRVTLPEGLVVAGTVTDDAGQPLSGVSVTARTSGTNFVPPRGLFLPNHEALPLTWVRTLSGADGAFRLRGVGEGRLDITGEKRGYPGMENPLNGFDPSGGPARIVMLRPFIASITVRDSETSDPLPRVAVTVSRVDAEEERAAGRTNHRGRFTGRMPWPAAQAPDCRVSIVAWDRRYGEIRADGIALEKVEKGKGFTLHAIRRDPGVVRLHVVYDTGEPYGQWIGFRFEVTAQVSQFRGGRPDEDGFVTMSVPAGTYPVVRAAAAGTVGNAEIAGLQVLSGVTVEESLVVERGGDVQFHFEGGDTADRVVGRMKLVSGDFTLARGVWGRDFTIRDLPPGDFEVTLQLRDYEPVTLPVMVVKGKLVEVPVGLRRR